MQYSQGVTIIALPLYAQGEEDMEENYKMLNPLLLSHARDSETPSWRISTPDTTQRADYFRSRRGEGRWEGGIGNKLQYRVEHYSKREFLL